MRIKCTVTEMPKCDAIDEELIVEIIGRFDEIGDLIDGRIDDNEQEEMLRALQD